MKRNISQKASKIISVAITAVLAFVAFFVFYLTSNRVGARAETDVWELTDITVTQNSGYIFTDGQKAENLRHVVTVNAVYTLKTDDEAEGEAETSALTLEYAAAAGDNAFTAVTGETVELVLSGTVLSVNVTAPNDGEHTGSLSVEKTVAVSAESNKTQIGISAVYLNNYAGELTTATVLTTDNFAVYKFFNNGFVGGEDDRLFGSDYSVMGNLFPDTKLTDNFDMGDGLYDTGVEISTNGTPKYTTSALVTGIKFQAPLSIGGFSGTLITQTAMSELDITGISISVGYFTNYTVPLNLFPKSSYECFYYKSQSDAMNNVNGTDEMTVSAQFCKIVFTYPSFAPVNGFFPIKVSPISIHTPTFPEHNGLDFYNGVSIDITDFDYSAEINGDDQPVINVSVDRASSDYAVTPKTDDASNKYYNIEFKVPNISYTITLSLTSDDNAGNYQWGAAQSNVTRVDDFTLEYTIQISKSVIVLEDLNGLEISWQYGKSYAGGAPVISATILNDEDTKLSFIYTEDLSQTDTEVGGETRGYYHIEYWNDENNAYEITPPKKAGEYDAIVVTHETTVWKPSTDYASNMLSPFVITATVTPVVISSDDILIADQTYDRNKQYDGNNILSAEKNKFVDEDGNTITAPLDITFENSDGEALSTVKYADTYGVTLELTDDNFVWDGVPEGYYSATVKPERTATVSFIVNKLSIAPTVSARGWTYGDDNTADSRFASSLNTAYSDYAVVQAPEFYTSADVKVTESELCKWHAGDYYVVFGTEYSGSDDDEKNSIVFNSAKASFTVEQKVIALSLTQDKHTYDHQSRVISINGFTDYIVNDDSNVLSKTVNSSAKSYDGDFTVKNADTYTVVVTVENADYKFANGSTVTLVYTVERATATLDETTGEITYDDTLAAQVIPDFAALLVNKELNRKIAESELTISYEITSGGNIVSAPLTAAGVYTFTFTVTGGTDKDNYVLADGLEYVYTISSAAIKAPTLLQNTATYDGKYHTLSEFIDEWQTYYGGYKLEFSVSVDANGTLTQADGNKMLNVGTYKIDVTPASSFDWADDVEEADADGVITYEFTVTPLTVLLDWTVTEVEYDGKAHTPTVVISNVKTNEQSGALDGISVVFGITATVAGRYSFTVNGLNDNDKGNYVLPAVGDDSLTGEFTVYKKIVSAPSMQAPYADTFGGETKTVNLYDPADYEAELFTATLTGKYPQAWFIGGSDGIVFTSENFDVASGVLSYRNAGVYAIAVALKDEYKSNYCLDENGKYDFDSSSGSSYSVEFVAAEIARKVVNAPSFGDDRAMEYDKYVAAFAELFGEFSQNEGLASVLEVSYGRRTADGGYDLSSASGTQLGGTTQGDIGQYYALLSLGADKYNYVWGNVEADNPDGSYSGASFILGNVCNIYYTKENGAEVYLHYAVTATQVDVKFTINGYTFGDNGAGYADENGGYAVNPSRIATDSVTAPDAAKYAFEFEIQSIATDIEINKVEYSFTYGESVLSADELVNGLPWNAGEYTVSITVTFKNTAYQPCMTTAKFTVEALEIVVEWAYNDGSDKQVEAGEQIELTYKGEAYEFTPVVKNIPVKADSDEAIAPELTVAKSNLTDAGDKLWVEIGGVESDDNYTFTAANTKLDINIKPATLVVIGEDVRHTYGDSIGYAQEFSIVGGTVYDRDSENIIAARIEDASGNVITSNLAAVVNGTYYVVPYIVATELGAGNYILDTSAEGFKADFTVVKREIKVEINDGAATSVYGVDGKDLNDPAAGVYTVTNLPSGESAARVFALSTSTTVTNRTPVGDYLISCTLNDADNYDLVFADNTYYYSVTAAAFIVDGEISDYTGTYNAAKQIIVPSSETAKVKSVDDSEIAWTYSTDGGNTWHALDDLELVHACEATAYTIRVEAANHTAREFEITVTVNKAALTVSIDAHIYYGEVDEWYTNYKASLSDLYDANGIYTVTGFYGDDESAFNDGALLGFGGAFRYAYADGVTAYASGDAAGKTYGLVFVGGELESSDYTFAGGGTLTVDKLPVTVTLDKQSYSATYGDPVEPVITVTTSAVSTQGHTISLEGLAAAYTVTNDALVGNSTNNVGNYTVTVSPTANYDFEQISAAYEITIATNRFTEDVRYLFVGGGTSTGEENAPYAWVYGDHDAVNNPDGYNASSGAKNDIDVINLVGTENDLTVTLYVSVGGAYTKVLFATASVANITSALKTEFASAWRDGSFVAGKYKVEYEMARSQNYEEFTYTEYFNVDRATLTVKPTDISVVYGESAEYDVEFDGFVENGGNKEDMEAAVGAGNVADVTDARNWNITGYTVGNGVGAYTISVSDIDGNNAALFANYKLAYDTGTLTVTARTMLVTVNNATNRYMLIGKFNGTDDYEKEALSTLSVTVHEQNGYYGYYGDEMPFDIVTDAVFVNANGNDATQDVGEYTIYLKFKDGCADNYIIEFIGCAASETRAGAIVGDANNAGTYTITPAQIRMNVRGPYYKDTNGDDVLYGTLSGSVYDGREKFYKAEPIYGSFDVPDKDSIQFEAVYYRITETADGKTSELLGDGVLPKDVGVYSVRFFSTGENKNFEEIEDTVTELHINYKSVNVSPSGLTVVYNGRGQNLTVSFTGLIDGETLKDLNIVSIEVTAKELDANAGAGLKHSDLPYSHTVTGNDVIITATEAAEYTVTIELDGSGNYAFASSEFISYTFTVERYAVTAWAQDVSVSYGAPVYNADGSPILYDYETDTAAGKYFGGFKFAYGVYTSDNDPRLAATNSDLMTLILDNAGNGYFDINLTADAYSPSKQANETFDIDFEIAAPNFKINLLENAFGTYKATLTVVPREIDLYVFDGLSDSEMKALTETVYNNGVAVWNSTHEALFNERFNANPNKYVTIPSSETGLYGESGDNGLDDLAIKLNIGNVSDVGEYAVSLSNSGNYAITYSLGGKPYGENNNITYKITPATLYVKAHKATGEYNNGEETLSVTYGDEITKSDCYVLSKGWLAGDASSLLVGKAYDVDFTAAGKAYSPYESHVGEKYTVTVDYTDTLKNYVIVCEPSYLEITPRVVSIDENCFESSGVFNSKMFTADGECPDGYYGAALSASVSFVGYNSNSQYAAVAELNKPTYTDSYNTVDATYNGVKYQSAGAAPRRAGDYIATITLNGNDYVFDNAGNKTLSYAYSVTKRTIYITWDILTIDASALEDNTISNYNSDIMEYLSFSLNTVEVTTTSDNFSASNSGLTFKPTSALGTYRMTIVFKDSASDNYCWVDENFVTQAIIEFRVSGDGLAFIENLVMHGWIYGDSSVTPTADLVTKQGDIISGATVRFEYVRVDTNSTEIDETDKEITATEFNGYKTVGTLSSTAPVNAGVYVLRACFDGNTDYSSANPVYYVFEVQKRAVQALDAEVKTVYDERDGEVYITYTIEGFDSTALIVVSSDVQTRVDSVVTDGGVRHDLVLTADRIKPNGFNIVFMLANTDNYEYLGELTSERIFVTWVVTASENNAVDFDENNVYSYTYGDSYTLGVVTYFTVGNIVEFYYLDKAHAAIVENGYAPAAGYDWHGGLPEHAGSYIIRAVSRSDSNSYNVDYAYHELVIAKATLSVRADGSAVYGMLSGNNGVSAYSDFTLVDPDGELKRGDAQKALRDEIAGNIVYTIDGVPSGMWGANDYALTLYALTADYEIVCITGVFTVEKATLSVVIDNGAWSYYGRPFDYSDATITVRGLISADGGKLSDYIERIRLKLSVDADETSGFGSYPVTVVGFEDANYTLDVTSGVYTIRKLPVTVVMDNGGYYYGETPVLPFVVGVYGGGILLTEFDTDLVTVVYADHATAPTDAGRYGYSIMLDTNCNYELSAPVSGIFEIFQITLDSSLIEFETVYYDNTVKAPTVIGVKGDAFSADEFDISYEGDWINAGVAYTIVLTLKNTDNTKWLRVEGAEQRIAYTISRGINGLVGDGATVSIEGWTYGEAVNEPKATTMFGSDKIVYEYSADKITWFGDIALRDAGEYYVRAVVHETPDYEEFYSEAVKFVISPVKLVSPVINVVSAGENRNDVYTASELGFEVTGVDFELMNVSYDGSVRLNGNNVTVYATDAGSYVVRVELKNKNYTWADGVKTDEDGNALLEWTVKKQQIALPTDNTATLIINGTLLEYLPIGFDPSLMIIDGNRAAYGGTFTATVTLIDTDNYEWADGTTGALTFAWKVVGANTVFMVVIGVLLGLSAVAAVAAVVLFVRYRNRKKAAAGGSGMSGGKPDTGKTDADPAKDTAKNNSEVNE